MNLQRVAVLLTIFVSTVHAKSTFTAPAAAITADKSAVFWPRKVPSEATAKEVYTVSVTLSDATGERAVRQVTVLADGRVFVGSVDTKVMVGAAFVTAVRTFGAVVDKLVEAVVKTGKVGL